MSNYYQPQTSTSSGFFSNSETDLNLETDVTISEQTVDVVIIGAGLAGLTAAFRIYQLMPGFSFRILEANNRVGGRIYTTELPASNNSTDLWDLGGSWIGDSKTQPYINQLIADLNLKTYPQYFEGSKIVHLEKKKIVKYNSSFPSPFGLLNLGTLLKSLDKTQKKVESSEKLEHYYDSITVDTMINKMTWSKSSINCSRAAMKALFGTEINKISALFFMKYVSGLGSLTTSLSSGKESSAQSFKIKDGSKSICSRIVSTIGIDKIIKRSVVISVTQKVSQSSKKSLIVTTTNGSVFKCKHVILAIPPNHINRINFEPRLSPIKYEYFSSALPGHTIKIILTYEKAFWREYNLSGEVVTYGGESHLDGCKVGPLCIVFDATTYRNSPALVGFICGEQAIQYENKTKEERKEAVIKSLEDYFESDQVRNFIVYCEKIWRQESYVGGCPLSSVPTGVGQYLGESIRSSENNIHFAGSEFGRVWMGYMEGAVESAERVALEVLE